MATASFRRVVEHRRHEVWTEQCGHIRHRPDQVCVEQVSEGSERALPEFLDACIAEADRHMRQERADRRDDQEALEHRRTEAAYAPEPKAAAARRMTERLRER